MEVYRTRKVFPGTPLGEVLGTDGTAEDLLALVPEDAVDDLAGMAEVAARALLPRLRDLAAAGPTWLAPEFAGSTLMKADADVVTGHALVELKTQLGDQSRGGSRPPGLSREVLRQLLGYVLHDHEDSYQIRAVALYQARYGHFTTWPLDELLPVLAGRQVDLAELRSRWAKLLRTGKLEAS